MKIKEEGTYLAQDKEKLLRLTRGRNTLQKVVLRANIILKIMEGLQKNTDCRAIRHVTTDSISMD